MKNLEELQKRRANAQSILNNPLFLEVTEAMRKRTFHEWISSDDKDRRDHLWYKYNIINEYENEMTKIIKEFDSELAFSKKHNK